MFASARGNRMLSSLRHTVSDYSLEVKCIFQVCLSRVSIGLAPGGQNLLVTRAELMPNSLTAM